ncbi:MAG: UDP-glucose--hexose-1-phosphate uridylyltransferase [Clostridia bacterium]|nr:UDP-glucose--hexose-1-phosphate uridylyltransferase [Clostridia bacterium]
MTNCEAIASLVEYGVKTGLCADADRIYATNLLLDCMKYDTLVSAEPVDAPLEEILGVLLDDARARGVIEDGIAASDLFDTRLMNCLMPRPSEVRKKFFGLYGSSAKTATDWYYRFSQDSDYIRRYRIKNDIKWVTKTGYGDIDITINLSKPEKDPKAIAAARTAKPAGGDKYPKCLLCPQNEGYAGRLDHPARENHRVIPLTIDGGDWFMQYSPYVYYNEHCIVFNGAHVPMVIDRSAFRKLFDFVKLFPHYFVGSNADLPIVGGSILTHEHFQGGGYEFAMAKAPVEKELRFDGYDDVKAGIVKWPMSVIRLSGRDTDRIVDLADKILLAWRGYTDEEAFIFAETDGTPHNTITPIARKRGDDYEIDLVLRCNITTEQYPDGVYHAHPEHHHLKRENIGLIEVMGLAVLPSRLKAEMAALADAIVGGKDITADPLIEKHAAWVKEFSAKYEKIDRENVDQILRDEIGLVFSQILEQCGVFARTPEGMAQFERFAASVK